MKKKTILKILIPTIIIALIILFFLIIISNISRNYLDVPIINATTTYTIQTNENAN